MEYLDIVDENGEPTGSTVERDAAHACGIRHRTSHVWLARRKNGRLQLLLQKRCQSKDSFPGCYDTSSAGHVPAGCDCLTSALRELSEELGITARADELIPCGSYNVSVDAEFLGRGFFDREFAMVYLLFRDDDEDAFIPQPEEVESVLWMDYDELLKAVSGHSISNCIVYDELLMLEPMLTDISEKEN